MWINYSFANVWIFYIPITITLESRELLVCSRDLLHCSLFSVKVNFIVLFACLLFLFSFSNTYHLNHALHLFYIYFILIIRRAANQFRKWKLCAKYYAAAVAVEKWRDNESEVGGKNKFSECVWTEVRENDNRNMKVQVTHGLLLQLLSIWSDMFAVTSDLFEDGGREFR